MVLNTRFKLVVLFRKNIQKREPNARGYICATLFLGVINTGTWPSRLGVSRIGTIKYGLESRGTVLARTSSNNKLQTRPLVREGATK
jgi:hypothetical protein